MALSTSSVLSTSVTPAGTAAVAAPVGLEVPENCHTIVVLNTHATNLAFVTSLRTGVGVGTALTTANAAQIAAGASLTLGISDESKRPGTLVMLYAASAGATVINITYVCGTGFSKF